MAEDRPGRLRWCECDGRRPSNPQKRFHLGLQGAPRAGRGGRGQRSADERLIGTRNMSAHQRGVRTAARLI